MTPRPIALTSPVRRQLAASLCMEAPDGWTAVIGPETRSTAQNRLLWPWLTAFSRQHQHYGRTLLQGDWKNLFMGALNGCEFVPSLDGQSVMPLGLSTRVLSKERFGKLLDLIDATAAERGVTLPPLPVEACR